MADLTRTLAAAIAAAPCTLRALARTAGLSPALLSLIVSGKRHATPEVAEKIARALEAWSRDCDRLARKVRRAARTRRA